MPAPERVGESPAASLQHNIDPCCLQFLTGLFTGFLKLHLPLVPWSVLFVLGFMIGSVSFYLIAQRVSDCLDKVDNDEHRKVE